MRFIYDISQIYLFDYNWVSKYLLHILLNTQDTRPDFINTYLNFRSLPELSHV